MPGETIGTAYVDVRPKTDGFEQQVRTGIAGPLNTALAGFATGVVASKVTGFFHESLTAASDFNESASKAQQIFGDNSNAIRKWAAGAVSDFGQTSTQALEN